MVLGRRREQGLYQKRGRNGREFENEKEKVGEAVATILLRRTDPVYLLNPPDGREALEEWDLPAVRTYGRQDPTLKARAAGVIRTRHRPPL